VRLWDVITGRELLTLTAAGQVFRTVSFSADGNRLLCGSEGGPCYVWNPASFAELDAE